MLRAPRLLAHREGDVPEGDGTGPPCLPQLEGAGAAELRALPLDAHHDGTGPIRGNTHTGGEPGLDGIPEGPFDARRLESPEVRQRFSDKLAEELHRMSLEWSGNFEELRDANSYEALYDLLLARIGLKSHEPSLAMAPPPVDRRFRLPRWLQRTH
ncbi:hypothetical protein [Archangium sp.]|uniref:hypothetical protein n=1 Tax=Archangium sp. TaxID=1872627 RepID=UPI002D227902|nr:hypothetical protein [Archangium sp.]HYO54162.1 hypothetical protein [Archangium sp.]